MFLRILKRDIKRKRTMNFIIILFVILSTMFVASGLNNVITVTGGTDYYLKQAGVGDWVIITSGEGSVGALDQMLTGTEAIKSYRLEDVVYGGADNLSGEKGEKIVCKNVLIMQTLSGSGITFFDKNNEPAKEPEKGHIYATGGFLKKNNLKPGDKINFKMSGVELTLIVDGPLKDALLGSDFMGNTRFIMNPADMETLLENETINRYSRGQICYIDSDDIKAVEAATSKLTVNPMFNKSSAIIKTAYVMDMVVAFITLILSLCLIIVAFVVLKFTITFTITEEYREIGVMKAIGIGNFKIRCLYLIKYLMIALAGALIGFALSFPFGGLLIKSVSDNMVLGNAMGILPNVLGFVIVVVSILFFAYISTGKVKKATPVDAIRSGQTGERYKKKSTLRLSAGKSKVPVFMAANDILSSPKRYTTIMIAFAVCTLFVLVLVNTVSTMKSEALITTFAARSDLYYGSTNELMSFMKEDGDQALSDYIKDTEDKLKDLGIPGHVFIDIQYAYPVYAGGKEYSINLQQGKNTKASMYDYMQGTAPQNKNEIAITPQIAEKLGVKIGDTITIDFSTEKLECMVVAYFQTMNQLGEIIRIHEDAPTNMTSASSLFDFQIEFDDHPSTKVAASRKDIISKELGAKDIFTAIEYQIDCLSVVPTMELVQYLLLAITLVVVVLVTILMERSFISDERNEIAILKAIGFRSSKVILWQVCRFGLVALMAVILAGLLSIPMTKLCISPIFGMMGAGRVAFVINPLKVFIIYPAIVLALTIAIAFLTALYTRHIKSSDTASIE